MHTVIKSNLYSLLGAPRRLQSKILAAPLSRIPLFGLLYTSQEYNMYNYVCMYI